MKHVYLLAVSLLPMSAVAGELIPITEAGELNGQASVEALDGTAAAPGLRGQTQAIGLVGSGSPTPLTGLSAADGLDGQGQGIGLEGVVEVPPVAPTPAPLPEPEIVIVPVTEPTRFELIDLHFEYDSAELAQSESAVIAELASIIVRTAPNRITLIGHTDQRGDSDYNLDLSERRARAVLNALVEWQGIDSTLFQIVGRGEDELLNDGLTEADHARNRRVVVILE